MTQTTSLAHELRQEGLRASAVLNACSLATTGSFLGFAYIPLTATALWTAGMLTSVSLLAATRFRGSQKLKKAFRSERIASWTATSMTLVSVAELLIGWAYLAISLAKPSI
jgi:hypothetical protein